MSKIPYVNVPNDLSKVKTKLAFNLTKRQLVCFGVAAAVGVPSYLLARSSIGNTGAMFFMMAVALPAFLLAMYEKDGLPLEKVVRNIIRARFLRPGVRPYRTENIYAPFTHRGAAGKEDAIAESKNQKRGPGKAADRKAALSAQQTIPYLVMHPDGGASSPAGSIQRRWNMRTSTIPWQAPRIRQRFSAAGVRSSITLTPLCRSSSPLSTAAPVPGANTG